MDKLPHVRLGVKVAEPIVTRMQRRSGLPARVHLRRNPFETRSNLFFIIPVLSVLSLSWQTIGVRKETRTLVKTEAVSRTFSVEGIAGLNQSDGPRLNVKTLSL